MAHPAVRLALPPLLLLVLMGPAGPVGVRAQEEDALRWALPAHACAVYERVHENVWTAAHRRYQRQPPWRGAMNPPLLFQGELDREGQVPTGQVSDLRDLPMRLAFDLRYGRAGGRTRHVFTDLRRSESIEVIVQYGIVDEQGRQDVVAIVRPAEEPDGRKRRRRYEIRGSLRARRTLDEAAGRVAAFESTLELDAKAPAQDIGVSGRMDSVRGEIRITERWTWREEWLPSQPAFATRVHQAIGRGVENLKGLLARRTWEPGDRLGPAAPGKHLRLSVNGELALILLALLKSDADPTDPVIARALRELRSRDIESTYSLSVAIMALEALHAPKGERKRLIEGTQAEPAVRVLPEQDRQLVARWAERLLESHDTRVDPGYELRWRYLSGPDYDNSNTQYALLGLYSAQLCGVRIPRHVWMSCAKHWLKDAREVEEPGVRLSLTTHPERKANARTPREGRTVVRRRPIQPLGWAYDQRDAISGSMTVAGIASATICRAMLGRRGGEIGKRRKSLEKAAERGFAWLSNHFTVRLNPGEPHSLCSRHYYLFGIERACEFSRIALFQDRDWYFEGAMWLLETQEDDGAWGHWNDTAFALLFLKKAAQPVVTAPN